MPELTAPSTADCQLAREGAQRLSRWISRKRKKPLHIRLHADELPDESVPLPTAAFPLLQTILQQMAEGNTLTLLPAQAELTTQQAADLLRVSRPFLIEQLEQGYIPFRKVGTHRRIQLRDLLQYKKVVDEKRLQTLDELAAQAQELGMGY